jgi:hypothetical protein
VGVVTPPPDDRLPAGRRRSSRLGPLRRRLPWWAEALLAVAGYEIYGLIQGATDGEQAAAVRHGWDLIRLEQRLHLWIEPTFNHWISGHRLLAISADYYYELTHAFVTAAVLVWLWRRRAASYARWRNILLGLSLAALIVFWTFPVAPPRLTTSALTDILVRYGALGAAHPKSGLVDLYAALPSLHVAWAVWCAVAVIAVGRRRSRWLALAYPILTSVVVLATANHYVIDVIAGAGLTAVAVGCAQLLAVREQRRRSPARAPIGSGSDHDLVPAARLASARRRSTSVSVDAPAKCDAPAR